jgi:hypothetical protein
MISPFQPCFLQFAQATVLFQGLEYAKNHLQTGQGLSNEPKYVKIGRLEPERRGDEKLQITLMILKPSGQIHRRAYKKIYTISVFSEVFFVHQISVFEL